MQLDKQHPVPMYLQLKALLQNQIEQGIYFPHQKLPSERNLCNHYNLSRMTARRALQKLIDEGLAYTRIGKGTFVSNKSITATRSSEGLKENTADYYQQKLTEHLSKVNCIGVEQTISEALATFSSEILALKIFPEIIKLLERRWHNGEINLLVQRYAITTLQAQLIAMMNAATPLKSGPKILLVCAPEDQHEIGLHLLALTLKRRGFRVIYLGQHVGTAEFQETISIVQPRLICCSAATVQSARSLAKFSHELYGHTSTGEVNNLDRYQQEPIFTFGGVAFNQNPTLVSEVAGLYLGDSIESAVLVIQQTLNT